jgi:hypothetical protein
VRPGTPHGARSGKDSIDRPPNSHDDVIDAAARVLTGFSGVSFLAARGRW